ncbi:hypothetical protein [Streptomyces cremeus]|uniref:Uncharacterized protein n=1 Tax=Streptomyces cremeus TaxID=66881 RepID=A0ABV5PGB4_STRCM
MTPKGTTPKKAPAHQPQPPLSRNILLLDIERYSDRDDVEQAYLRRMLYEITDRTLIAAGIDATRRLRADRGDSVMELIDANTSLIDLLRALLSETPIQLRATNRKASTSAQIRLRAVLATGYVAIDENGWVGADLNFACRLLDADELRKALKRSEDDFALCVSDPVHRGIVRHNHPGIPAEKFHPVVLDGKNGAMEAWLYGPVPAGEGGTPAPGGHAAPPSPAPTGEPQAEPPGTASGAYVHGNQTGIAGGTFTAPITFGDLNPGGSR